MVKSLFGSNVSNDLPVYIEAWGASGGHGQGLHSPGGSGGYARTSQTLATLSQIVPGLTLRIYTGLAGANGTANNEPGRGGASTLVLTSTDLPDIGSNNTVTDPRGQGVLLMAGGGGSWARQAAVDDSGAPVVGPTSPGSNGDGVVSITFDVCAVEPGRSYCATGAQIAAIQPQALVVAEPGGSTDVILLGDRDFDPSQLDPQRFLLNYSGSGPFDVLAPCDLNGDGFLDLEIHFQGNAAIDLKDKVQCVQGALHDGTPVRACATATNERDSTLCHADSCVAGECVTSPMDHSEDDGCAIAAVPRGSAQMGSLLLSFFGVFLVLARRRAAHAALRAKEKSKQ